MDPAVQFNGCATYKLGLTRLFLCVRCPVSVEENEAKVDQESGSASGESSSDESAASSKFDFGPPLLFSGDSLDVDSLPGEVRSRMEVITIRRQMVGKLGRWRHFR